MSASSTNQAKVGRKGILYRTEQLRDVGREEGPLSEAEKTRKEVAERYDKQGLLVEEGLLSSANIVVDEDEKLLKPPESVEKLIGGDVVIARVPPKVEFGMVPAQPTFFHEPDEGKRTGLWSNWSQSAYYGPTGKFYTAVGDHIEYNAHLYIVEYDPATRTIRCFPEINKILGRTRDVFGDGKIHGWLDFYDGSDLWFCTYWCKYPEPEEEDFATGYDGGHIMSLDVTTGDIVDYGVPLVRASWPYHRVDTRRGLLYAVGMFSEFLVWDIKEQETRWAGYLPEGMQWFVRTFLIDEETGMVYSSNQHPGDVEKHLLKYDPFKNRCVKLDAHMPKNSMTGDYECMRANTEKRGPDGLYYGMTYHGQMFSFDPATETIEDKGINWPGEQRYTASMERSPGGRYIYYCPGAHGRGFMEGSPLLQYDTETGQRKVLAFLHPYHNEKYGYTTGGTFSVKLDDKGEKLFIIWNGAFIEPRSSDVFGNNAFMLVNLPEEERQE